MLLKEAFTIFRFAFSLENCRLLLSPVFHSCQAVLIGSCAFVRVHEIVFLAGCMEIFLKVGFIGNKELFYLLMFSSIATCLSYLLTWLSCNKEVSGSCSRAILPCLDGWPDLCLAPSQCGFLGSCQLSAWTPSVPMAVVTFLIPTKTGHSGQGKKSSWIRWYLQIRACFLN